MAYHPADNGLPVFKRLPLRIFQRIPLANYFSGIDSKLLRLSTRGNGGGADAFVSNCFADSCAHYLCLSNRFKNGDAKRIATQAINLECGLDTPVGSVEALNAWLESNTGAWPLHQLIASSQAERNILLWKGGVNSILWCSRF